MINNLSDQSKKSRSANTKASIGVLLKNVMGYFIDREILKNPNDIVEESIHVLNRVITKLKQQSYDFSSFIKEWNGDEWSKIIETSAINDYKKLLKS